MHAVYNYSGFVDLVADADTRALIAKTDTEQSTPATGQQPTAAAKPVTTPSSSKPEG